MEITYLLNSGFMIKDKDILMLFDDFDDPSMTADKVIGEGNFKQLYIFVSHAHFDHFGTHIRAYAPQVTKYIFSYDLKRTRRVKLFPAVFLCAGTASGKAKKLKLRLLIQLMLEFHFLLS